MQNITNLGQLDRHDIKKIIESNSIVIKKQNEAYYTIICPKCEKTEAYIYTNRSTKKIECNRVNKCGYQENLWDYVCNLRGYSNEEMIEYINEISGRLFFNYKDKSKNTNHFYNKEYIKSANKDNSSKIVHRNDSKLKNLDMDLIGIEILESNIDDLLNNELEQKEMQEFFENCNEIFINYLNNNSDKSNYSLKYIKEIRGYTEDQIKSFGLGFFPDQNQFTSLLEKYYKKEKINELILKYFNAILSANRYEKEEAHKNRITIPWYNLNGLVIGFSVRKNSDYNGMRFKYINNTGLTRSTHLFNFTKDSIDKNIVIVEGQFDALVGTYTMKESNYHFVAIGGSSISENQALILKKEGCSKVILFPDNDNAGKNGMLRSADILLKQNIDVFIPEEIEYKDVDQIVKQDKEKLQNILNSSIKYEKPPELDSEAEKSTVELNFETQKLIDEIIHDARDELGNHILIDIHKYSKKIQEVKIKALMLNINFLQRNTIKSTELDILNNAILKYNQAIKNEADNQPYTHKKFLEDIEKDENKHLKLGYFELDKYISIPPSSLTFIAGRPSHGKTTFMLNVLVNMIKNNPDKKFILYSYEEKNSDILLKLMLIALNDQNLKTRLYDDAVTLKEKVLNYFRNSRNSFVSRDSNLDNALHTISEWIREERLVILNPKSSVESLSASIIDRCTSQSSKKISAVFIDYVQKLNTEQKMQSRQQEIQKICQILLNTCKDERVNTSIILGAQVNRSVTSFENLSLDNMREAGDIEQDANIVLGIWNEQSGKIDRLLKTIANLEDEIDKKRQECLHTIELEDRANSLRDKLKQVQNENNECQKIKIRVLKNRNGKNNIVSELEGYLDRFCINDSFGNTIEKSKEIN